MGVLGVVVGLGGIYVTVLSFPGPLDALGSALAGTGMPVGVKGLAGAITISIAVLFIAILPLFSLVFAWFDVPNAKGNALLAVCQKLTTSTRSIITVALLMT
jgi:hypothetical protein